MSDATKPSAASGADEVLLELTKDHLESGLRGVPVGYCTTSAVEADQGLFYVGNPVEAIGRRDPEDVIYLLLYKQWPNPEQLSGFRRELMSRAAVETGVFESMKALPRHGHPMKWFNHAINVLGMYSSHKGDYRKDGIDLIAKIPTVTAAIFRLREGWGEPIAPRQDLGYMENFVHMLGVPGLDTAQQARLAQVMRVFDVTHFDHGGGNLSTFTGKTVASGKADMYESIGAAMAGLAGPLHGRANQECLEFIKECVNTVGSNNLNAETVRTMIQARLDAKQVIYGFGHAVLRVEDPRARVLRAVGEELCPDFPLFKMVKLLAQVVPPILKANPKISNPYPNVDSASGALLQATGLTEPEYYTVLFGMSRVVGIAAQIIYERCEARGGKGVPIMRPKYYYSPDGTAKGEAVIAGSG
jgi:citrate synthase